MVNEKDDEVEEIAKDSGGEEELDSDKTEEKDEDSEDLEDTESLDEFVESHLQNPNIVNVGDVTLSSGETLPNQPVSDGVDLDKNLEESLENVNVSEDEDEDKIIYGKKEGLYEGVQGGEVKFVEGNSLGNEMVSMVTPSRSMIEGREMGMMRDARLAERGIDSEKYIVERDDKKESQKMPWEQKDKNLRKYESKGGF